MQAARGAAVDPDGPPARERDLPDRRPGHGRRGRGRIAFLLVALAGFLTDLVTKTAAVRALEPGVPVPVVDSVLRLLLIRNPGAAFSLGERFTVVFPFLYLAVLAFVLFRLVPHLGHRGWAVALGLLCAGVAGNLVDRVFRAPGFLRGHVVDFLQLPHWPIFNVADICITAAAGLIVVLAFGQNTPVTGLRTPQDGQTR